MLFVPLTPGSRVVPGTWQPGTFPRVRERVYAGSRWAAHPAGPRAPHSGTVKSKMPADREQPTLSVPSAVRSPGNLRRKTSTFSLLSDQFSHRPGTGCFAARGRKFWENHGLRSLGPLQGVSGDRWAVSEFLPNHVDGTSETRQGGLLSCFMPYRAGQVTRREETK